MLIKLAKTKHPIEKQIEKFKNEYMQEHWLFNPKKNAANTKQALFNQAWGKFKKHEVWKKLPKFYNGYRYQEGKCVSINVMDFSQQTSQFKI